VSHVVPLRHQAAVDIGSALGVLRGIPITDDSALENLIDEAIGILEQAKRCAKEELPSS